MATNLDRYPELKDYLDDTDEYENEAVELKHGDDRFLIVTQRGPDGQQVLFKWNGHQFEYWDNETIINSALTLPGFAAAPAPVPDAGVVQCGPSSADDHKKVFQYVLSQVNRFDSSSGPDGGNLACCWTVRNVVKNAIGRWITKTDGTAEFGQELRACFGHGYQASDVPPGGIIISPSQSIPGSTKRNIGHVGFVGEGTTATRLVYSNSSADKRLEQNYTVASWTARYHDRKTLSVLFYPLPLRSVMMIS